jgi:predicted permease
MSPVSDLRYAARRLAKRPGFLLAVLITLGLGIGFNILAFGFVNAFLLRPLPIAQPDRVVSLTFGAESHPNESYPNYIDIRDRNQAFSQVSAVRFNAFGLSGAGRAARVFGYEVSGNYFDLLGIAPWRGRFIQPSDDQKSGASPVAVISYGTWQRRFGSDSAVIGKTVRLNGHPLTIIGIAPPGFIGTERFFNNDLWVPMSMLGELEGGDSRSQRGDHNFWVIARLLPGMTTGRAEASLRVLATRMAREYPSVNEGFRMGIAPVGLLGATLRGPFIGIGGALLLVSSLTLLVACTNIAGLLLAHAAARRKEIAIRYAIGAGRGAVLRMMLSECLLIAFAGGALGVSIGTGAASLLQNAIPALDLPLVLVFSLDWRVALFAVLLSALSAILFGLLPGLRASGIDVAAALKSETATTLPRRLTMRDVFVGIQVAVCMILVAAALMMVSSLKHMLSKSFGFATSGAVTLRVDPEMQGYTEQRGRIFARDLLARARSLPGVESAAIADRLPLSLTGVNESRIEIEGAPALPEARRPSAVIFLCTPDFFRTAGIRLMQGRDFDSRDTAKSTPVAVVNKIFADKLLPGRNPIGARFHYGAWMQIVGVVEPGKYETIGEDPMPAFWRPFSQDYWGPIDLVVRSGQADAGLLSTLTSVIHSLDPDLAVTEAHTMRQHLDLPTTPLRLTTMALTAMGVVVLFLSALGLYGVLAYTTAQRTREIGIRMALGARARDVVGPVMSRTLMVVAAAAVIGFGIAVPATRLLAGMLSGEADITAPMAATATLAAVCMLAALVPLRRALNVDPSTALRQE